MIERNMPVARVSGLTLRYRTALALDDVDLTLPQGAVTGLVGPDGAGKTSLLAVLAGARRVQHGEVEVLGGDMRRAAFRARACQRIAYMPQGLGSNLLASLSVSENLAFFARLFGQDVAMRTQRIELLAHALGLHPFLDRPAGQLSGGMKQKLGLCCALIHDPQLMILDEPTTGIDPLARERFWALIGDIRRARPGLSVVAATAYMDEAMRFDWLVAVDAGRVLASGAPEQLLLRTGSTSMEQAFVRLLPPGRRIGACTAAPRSGRLADKGTAAIEAVGLWRSFGDFVAVRDVSFRIARGEIFGFIGSNGSGKSTTMKMLAGLLAPSSGQARLFGRPVEQEGPDTRRRVGYMSQGFSLYTELSVRQNLMLHARLFGLPESRVPERCALMARRFDLEPLLDALPARLPPGVRQRLGLAVAMVHGPELLILDEPTSGVDPIARDYLWEQMLALSREDGVTIFISTHFMNEAERCDRVALMHHGRVLASGTPAALRAERGTARLEEAFVAWLRESDPQGEESTPPLAQSTQPTGAPMPASSAGASWRRVSACCWRETIELWRDPVRAMLAALGSLLLMLVIGYGINLDVEALRYAVLDRDQTTLSRDYALNLSGSRYFLERVPLSSYTELDRRMRSGELALALEIPPGFGRAAARGRPVEIGAWIDGANPVRAETVDAYVQGMHDQWLARRAKEAGILGKPVRAVIETRFRYNPDVRSMPAMVPAIIALLLLNLPAMQAALAVVREKELGSIVNLYVTPLRRSQFLLGKQIPYVVLAMLNAVLMTVLAVTVLDVPFKGDVPAFALAVFLFCICSTGIGLLASAFTRSQIGAVFLTMIGTMVPAIQYAGLINPVTALEGAGRAVGEAYPASHMLTICRGVFSKALGIRELGPEFLALLAAIPVILGAAIAVLPRQER